MRLDANVRLGHVPRHRPDTGANVENDIALDDALRSVKRPKAVEPKPVKRADDRRRGKLTLGNALDDSERERSLASVRRRRERERARGLDLGPREKIVREVVVPETITIQELANRMAERGVDVIKLLMKQGQLLKINDVIDADLAQLIAEEMGHTVRRVRQLLPLPAARSGRAEPRLLPLPVQRISVAQSPVDDVVQPGRRLRPG